ncbi:hypothetical protein GCM10022415_00880 [Knoellia locipacati]|uniref:SseB protein N-terminal domain-containing protein n=1 Tax=Knoellia locipacati TaxID=882824 RepID=A0A512SVR3_9MICO|nr:hypothetical protein [Knoellia locipacati]GEQ12041.1 hypothetical protein KLO01_00880 [Knoellia locipacati]
MSDATGTPSIDSLAEVVRTSGADVDAQSALWGAMFGLDKWWFIARGTLPDVSPVVGVVDGVPSLLAFTSGARARECALTMGFAEEKAGQALAVAPQSVLETTDHLMSQGVQRLVVDQGVLGFFAPLGQLRPIAEFVAQSRG